jgi:phosphopentomutase
VCFGKLAEVSAGKDTTIGHWEMAGIYSPDPSRSFYSYSVVQRQISYPKHLLNFIYHSI